MTPTGPRWQAVLNQELQRGRRQLLLASIRPEARQREKAIHETRKTIKKLRAACRLIAAIRIEAEVGAKADATPHKALREVAFHLRNAAKALGTVRDGVILRRTARRTAKEAGISPSQAQAGLLRRCFKEKAGDAAIPIRFALAELAKTTPLLAQFPWTEIGPDGDGLALANGLKRIWRRGREAMRRAERKGPGKASNKALHRWRKWTKDLHYNLGFAALAPSAALARIENLRETSGKLARLLGDDHDLALLEERLPHPPGPNRNQHDPPPRALQKYIRTARRQLQKKAFRQGRRLYGSFSLSFRPCSRVRNEPT